MHFIIAALGAGVLAIMGINAYSTEEAIGKINAAPSGGLNWPTALVIAGGVGVALYFYKKKG